MRRAGIIALLAFLAGAEDARALEVELFPEGVRFDLANGKKLDPPRAEPRSLGRDRVTLRVVRDEVVAFQIRLRGASELIEVRTSSIAPGVVPDVFYERGVAIGSASETPAVKSCGAGEYPDALVPTSTITIPAAPGVAMLWVDIFVPRDTPPGKYSGKIEFVRPSGTQRVEVALEVLDFELPHADLAGLGAVNFGSLLKMEAIDPAILLRWMQLAHAHHLTVELMRPVPKIAEDGTIDWEGYAERIGPYIDGTAFSRAHGYRGPREGDAATRFMVPLCEWWPVKARAEDGFLPSDRERWSHVLREWESFVIRRGWFARPNATEWIMFINALDEPKSEAKLDAIKAYGPLIEGAKLVDRRHLTFRVDGVIGQRIEGWSTSRMIDHLGGVVDLWNLHGAPETAPMRELESRRQLGENFLFYASNSGGEPAIPPLVVDSPIAGVRAWAWIVERYALSGALNWEIDPGDGCVANPKCSEGQRMNLDALLVYRGHEVGRGLLEPIASMRLKALRRGAQDVALLSLLADRDANQSRIIAREMVPHALGDGVSWGDSATWPKDGAIFDTVRERILDRLSGIDIVSRPDEPRLPWNIIAVALTLSFAIALLIWARSR